MGFTTLVCIFTMFLVASSYVIENEEQLLNKGEKKMLVRVKRQETSPQPPVETIAVSVTNAPIIETQTPPTVLSSTLTPDTPPPTVGPGISGVSCSPDIYKIYAAKCCLLPPLLDEDMTKKCSVTMRTFPPFAISQQGGRGVGNRMANPFRYQFKSMPVQKNLSGKITVEQIMFSNNSIDTASLFQALTTIIPQEPSTYNLLYSTVNDCSQYKGVLSQAENATSMLRQRKCFHAPTKMLRCIRRSMLLLCPQHWSLNPYILPKHCIMDKMMLEKCDINTI